MWAVIGKFLAGTAGRWLLGGAMGALVVAGGVMWHQYNFVSRAELNQWKDYTSNLIQAIEERDRKLQRYETAKEADNEKIEQMEREREKLLEEDRKSDSGVILDSDDLRGLRDYSRPK